MIETEIEISIESRVAARGHLGRSTSVLRVVTSSIFDGSYEGPRCMSVRVPTYQT